MKILKMFRCIYPILNQILNIITIFVICSNQYQKANKNNTRQQTRKTVFMESSHFIIIFFSPPPNNYLQCLTEGFGWYLPHVLGKNKNKKKCICIVVDSVIGTRTVLSSCKRVYCICIFYIYAYTHTLECTLSKHTYPHTHG